MYLIFSAIVPIIALVLPSPTTVYINYVFFPFMVMYTFFHLFVAVPITQSGQVLITWAEPVISAILIILGLILINPLRK